MHSIPKAMSPEKRLFESLVGFSTRSVDELIAGSLGDSGR